MPNITTNIHLSDWFSARSSWHSRYFCIDFHNTHWEGASSPPYGCCFVLNAPLGCRRLSLWPWRRQHRRGRKVTGRRLPLIAQRPSKRNMALGEKMQKKTKRRGTVPHTRAAHHKLIRVLGICKSLWLSWLKQRKPKRFQGARRLSESSPAESLRTSNNSDWFTCQTLLCSDILPAPCGVCALARMPACARMCVRACVRMHVTMFAGALGCTRAAAVCMHCATCWWRWLAAAAVVAAAHRLVTDLED